MKKYIYKDIILTGSAGLSGALELAAGDPERMRERFPGHMLRQISELEKNLKPSGFSLEDEDAYIREIGKKGLSAALWDMGEELGTGFSVFADRFPVSQLTVEICELFGADPLKVSSEGCFLACTANGNELCGRLKAQGADAVIIGHTESSRGKVLVMGEIRRFLDKPR